MIAINLSRDMREQRADRTVVEFACSPRWEEAAIWVFWIAVLAMAFVNRSSRQWVWTGLTLFLLAHCFIPLRVRRRIAGIVTGRHGVRTRHIYDPDGRRLPRMHEVFLLGIEAGEDQAALRPATWPDVMIRRGIRLLPVRKRIPHLPPELGATGGDAT